MSWWLLLVLAALTYASRAAGLALLPAPPNSLVSPDRSAASVPVLGATAGALCVVPTRSFPIVLVGGMAGYAIASALT